MSGSAKLLFPRTQGGALDAVILNSAGGVTGGDRFDLAMRADANAALRITTQAAERIYRAQPGEPGRVRTTLKAAPGALVQWLPQETIVFDGAALDRRLDIDIAAEARVLTCETLVFGRQAMGETVQSVYLRDHVDLRIGAELVFADRLKLDGNAAQILTRDAVAGGAIAMASVLFVDPAASARLSTLRDMLPVTAGASALRDNVVFLRLLAADSFELRKSLVPVLRALAGGDLPRPWML